MPMPGLNSTLMITGSDMKLPVQHQGIDAQTAEALNTDNANERK